MTEACRQISIAELRPADLDSIAAVHAFAFPFSATTRIGREAIKRYYGWQFEGPHEAHFLGAWVDDNLEGFCFCGTFRGALGGYIARNRWFLVRQLLSRPGLWKHAEIRSAAVASTRRIFQRPAPRESTAAPQPKRFGILSIAVSPRCRGLGLGARLMHAAEQAARQRGFAVMGLTVHPTNTTAVRFYEKLGWMRVPTNGLWSGRMEKVIAPTPANISHE